jgi:hypothetical protein
MKSAFRYLLATCAAIWFTPLLAQPNKLAYELQERCAKSSAEMFARDFKDATQSGITADYENHYNSHSNKCFSVERSTQYLKDNGKPVIIKIFVLIDVNENKVYGSFDPLQCKVANVACHSEEEWKSLIRPYMEE